MTEKCTSTTIHHSMATASNDSPLLSHDQVNNFMAVTTIATEKTSQNANSNSMASDKSGYSNNNDDNNIAIDNQQSSSFAVTHIGKECEIKDDIDNCNNDVGENDKDNERIKKQEYKGSHLCKKIGVYLKKAVINDNHELILINSNNIAITTSSSNVNINKHLMPQSEHFSDEICSANDGDYNTVVDDNTNSDQNEKNTKPLIINYGELIHDDNNDNHLDNNELLIPTNRNYKLKDIYFQFQNHNTFSDENSSFVQDYILTKNKDLKIHTNQQISDNIEIPLNDTSVEYKNEFVSIGTNNEIQNPTEMLTKHKKIEHSQKDDLNRNSNKLLLKLVQDNRNELEISDIHLNEENNKNCINSNQSDETLIETKSLIQIDKPSLSIRNCTHDKCTIKCVKNIKLKTVKMVLTDYCKNAAVVKVACSEHLTSASTEIAKINMNSVQEEDNLQKTNEKIENANKKRKNIENSQKQIKVKNDMDKNKVQKINGNEQQIQTSSSFSLADKDIKIINDDKSQFLINDTMEITKESKTKYVNEEKMEIDKDENIQSTEQYIMEMPKQNHMEIMSENNAEIIEENSMEQIEHINIKLSHQKNIVSAEEPREIMKAYKLSDIDKCPQNNVTILKQNNKETVQNKIQNLCEENNTKQTQSKNNKNITEKIQKETSKNGGLQNIHIKNSQQSHVENIEIPNEEMTPAMFEADLLIKEQNMEIHLTQQQIVENNEEKIDEFDDIEKLNSINAENSEMFKQEKIFSNDKQISAEKIQLNVDSENIDIDRKTELINQNDCRSNTKPFMEKTDILQVDIAKSPHENNIEIMRNGNDVDNRHHVKDHETSVMLEIENEMKDRIKFEVQTNSFFTTKSNIVQSIQKESFINTAQQTSPRSSFDNDNCIKLINNSENHINADKEFIENKIMCENKIGNNCEVLHKIGEESRYKENECTKNTTGKKKSTMEKTENSHNESVKKPKIICSLKWSIVKNKKQDFLETIFSANIPNGKLLFSSQSNNENNDCTDAEAIPIEHKLFIQKLLPYHKLSSNRSESEYSDLSENEIEEKQLTNQKSIEILINLKTDNENLNNISKSVYSSMKPIERTNKTHSHQENLIAESYPICKSENFEIDELQFENKTSLNIGSDILCNSDNTTFQSKLNSNDCQKIELCDQISFATEMLRAENKNTQLHWPNNLGNSKNSSGKSGENLIMLPFKKRQAKFGLRARPVEELLLNPQLNNSPAMLQATDDISYPPAPMLSIADIMESLRFQQKSPTPSQAISFLPTAQSFPSKNLPLSNDRSNYLAEDNLSDSYSSQFGNIENSCVGLQHDLATNLPAYALHSDIQTMVPGETNVETTYYVPSQSYSDNTNIQSFYMPAHPNFNQQIPTNSNYPQQIAMNTNYPLSPPPPPLPPQPPQIMTQQSHNPNCYSRSYNPQTLPYIATQQKQQSISTDHTYSNPIQMCSNDQSLDYMENNSQSPVILGHQQQIQVSSDMNCYNAQAQSIGMSNHTIMYDSPPSNYTQKSVYGGYVNRALSDDHVSPNIEQLYCGNERPDDQQLSDHRTANNNVPYEQKRPKTPNKIINQSQVSVASTLHQSNELHDSIIRNQSIQSSFCGQRSNSPVMYNENYYVKMGQNKNSIDSGNIDTTILQKTVPSIEDSLDELLIQHQQLSNIKQPKNTLPLTSYQSNDEPSEYYQHKQRLKNFEVPSNKFKDFFDPKQQNPIENLLDMQNIINLRNYQMNPQHLHNFISNSQMNLHAKQATLNTDLNNIAPINETPNIYSNLSICTCEIDDSYCSCYTNERKILKTNTHQASCKPQTQSILRTKAVRKLMVQTNRITRGSNRTNNYTDDGITEMRTLRKRKTGSKK